MKEILYREFVYLWYYFDIQLRQIFWYWVTGIIGLVFASALGIASPLCMYGTIPISASFSQKGIRDDFLASFMMASVLLNPQLIIYSAALDKSLLAVRIITCFICGITAGFLVRIFFCERKPHVSEQNAPSESTAFSENTRYFNWQLQ